MPNQTLPPSESWAEGRDLAAQLLGISVTLINPDPVHAFAAPAVVMAARHALDHARELCLSGFLASREKIRLSALEILVRREIKRRIEGGELPREDGFFDEYTPGRSDADEVTEAIFRIAQRDPQERKLPYVASLLASIVFERAVDAGFGHHLVELAGSLSFRKLCILRLAKESARFDLFDRDIGSVGRDKISGELLSILADIFDLKYRTLLSTGTDMDLNAFEIRPARMLLEKTGILLHDLMGLEKMLPWEIRNIAGHLSFGHSPIPPKAGS